MCIWNTSTFLTHIIVHYSKLEKESSTTREVGLFANSKPTFYPRWFSLELESQLGQDALAHNRTHCLYRTTLRRIQQSDYIVLLVSLDFSATLISGRKTLHALVVHHIL